MLEGRAWVRWCSTAERVGGISVARSQTRLEVSQRVRRGLATRHSQGRATTSPVFSLDTSGGGVTWKLGSMQVAVIPLHIMNLSQ